MRAEIGNRRHGKRNQQQKRDGADYQIGDIKVRIACVHIPRCRKNDMGADEHAGNPAKPIAHLREIDAPRRARVRPEHGGVRIGDGLQTRKPRSDHKKPQKKGPICIYAGGGNEPERSQTCQGKAGRDPALIAETPRDPSRRQGHQEIAHIKSVLHKAGLEFRKRQRILEMLVEIVEETAGKAPQQKKAGDKKKYPKIAPAFGRAKQVSTQAAWHSSLPIPACQQRPGAAPHPHHSGMRRSCL